MIPVRTNDNIIPATAGDDASPSSPQRSWRKNFVLRWQKAPKPAQHARPPAGSPLKPPAVTAAALLGVCRGQKHCFWPFAVPLRGPTMENSHRYVTSSIFSLFVSSLSFAVALVNPTGFCYSAPTLTSNNGQKFEKIWGKKNISPMTEREHSAFSQEGNNEKRISMRFCTEKQQQREEEEEKEEKKRLGAKYSSSYCSDQVQGSSHFESTSTTGWFILFIL